ncbi:MAG: thioredoxin domain-containing protein [Planctomycetota bacterium]|jgi:uncharacterized protein YyaL (SSP411 family)
MRIRPKRLSLLIDPSDIRSAFLSTLIAVVALSLSGCDQQEPTGGTAASDSEGFGPSRLPSTADPASDTTAANDSAALEAEGVDIAATPDDQPSRAEEAPLSIRPVTAEHSENRLANETSPYLLLHAKNPVDWFPWGPEAFEKAKREQKPIFLSIGYSSCYWCHVMERLVFENEEIARYMNENFVNIKVDREERPDVDDIYMLALQVYQQLSGSGGGSGWPLSMFLTPEGQPIAGGTYFPPKDTSQQMGFPSIMARMVDAWTNQREQVLQGAAKITDYVKREMRPGLALEKPELTRELVNSVVRSVVQSHDPEFGGFDFSIDRPDAPKFPVPVKLALLQYQQKVSPSTDVQLALNRTLQALTAGGIRDHLGGGFHRYSTDRRWVLPHFEKMLYDNAQLADVFIEAYRSTQKPEYREVAEETLDFILTEMTDPSGGFHSALDAETEGVEGRYYVWSLDQVERLTGPHAREFIATYGMLEAAPFEHGYVLHFPQPLLDAATELKVPPQELRANLRDARRRLLAARRQRQAPLTDDKILTSWNGLMIRAFANAANAFGQRRYLDAAERGMMFVLTSMRDREGRLLRTWRSDTAKLNAYLDDYAFVVDALLTLHLTTRDDKWLNAARRLTDDQLAMFWDDAGSGFFFTSHHHEELLARTKNGWDSVLPSGNSVSVRNLIRLASLTGEASYREKAQKVLELFAPQFEQNPRGAAYMAIALGEYLDADDYRTLRDRLASAQPPKTGPQPDASNTTDPPADPPATEATVTIRNPEPRKLTQPETDAATGEARPEKKAVEHRVMARAFLATDRLPPGGKSQIAVMLTIEPGWHINTNPAHPEFLIPTEISLKSQQGVKMGEPGYPAGGELKLEGLDSAYHVYEGEVNIIADLTVPESAASTLEEFELTIRYQACNDQNCERPKTLRFTAQVPVAAKGEPVNAINKSVFRKK